MATDVHDRILNGARRLLFSRGYPEFTLEALAGEIGVARKTIYNHFPGREALLEAVFQYDAEQWVSAVLDVVESRSGTFTDKASLLMKLSAARLRERGEIFSQVVGLRRQLLRRQNNETFREVVVGPLSKLFSEGAASGHVRPDINPELLTRGLLNVIFGHERRTGEPPEALASILTEMLHALSVGVLTEKGRNELSVERRST